MSTVRKQFRIAVAACVALAFAVVGVVVVPQAASAAAAFYDASWRSAAPGQHGDVRCVADGADR